MRIGKKGLTNVKNDKNILSNIKSCSQNNGGDKTKFVIAFSKKTENGTALLYCFVILK